MISAVSLIPEIILDLDDRSSLMTTAVIITLSVIAAIVTSGYASVIYKSNKKKTTAVFVLVTIVVAVYSNLFFGATVSALKNIILSLILLFASVADIKTRECPDCIHLMIFITAFIGNDISIIPGRFFASLFVGGVMLLTFLLTKSKIGGADIKIVAAMSFALGMVKGTAGMFIGVLFAVIINAIKKNRKEGFPMIPYLAAGYIAVLQIQI